MSADTPNVGNMVTIIGAVIAAVIAVLGFWTKYVIDRISGAKEEAARDAAKAQRVAERADAKADTALQEAAEAKQESREAREASEEMYRTMHDEMVRSNRETGESNSAIRVKINDVELFMRDNFARKDDLAAAVMKIEAGQIRTDTKIEAGQTRTDQKIDEIRELIRNGS